LLYSSEAYILIENIGEEGNPILRILLAGGGSGGHVFPLVAVYRKILEISNGEAEFLFMGPDFFSNGVFRKEGVRTRIVFSGKFRRYFSIFNLLDVFKFPVGFIQTYWHIFWFMPDVIFAKGGYGSVLPVLVGWMFRIPVIIHESDAAPGLANKMLCRFAKFILVSFEESVAFFPKGKTFLTGNPIRNELFLNIPQNAREVLGMKSSRPVIVVFGGSQGSEQINDLILISMPDLAKKYEIVHQCGRSREQDMKKGALLQIHNIEERNFYHVYGLMTEPELASAYASADLIVSRAGSGAIFEIASFGKPSILIPYNGGASSHQEKNAFVYADTGAGIVLEDENLKPHIFLNSIDSILSDAKKLEDMKIAALNFAKLDAAEKIAKAVLALGRQS